MAGTINGILQVMIDQLIEKIIQNPLLLRLKNVVENNSYHDHQDVYSHVIQTKNIALMEIAGNFISNPDAKKSFLEFVNENFHDMKRSDIMVLTALLHDIGKILTVKDNNKSHPFLVTNDAGITACPGHEYWGSTIVGKVIEDLSLPKEVVDLIANVIKLHDTFSENYFKQTAAFTWDLLLNDVKSRAENLYKEALFNIYCDCFNAAPFEKGKQMIIKLFNEPKLYERREYVIS